MPSVKTKGLSFDPSLTSQLRAQKDWVITNRHFCKPVIKNSIGNFEISSCFLSTMQVAGDTPGNDLGGGFGNGIKGNNTYFIEVGGHWPPWTTLPCHLKFPFPFLKSPDFWNYNPEFKNYAINNFMSSEPIRQILSEQISVYGVNSSETLVMYIENLEGKIRF